MEISQIVEFIQAREAHLASSTGSVKSGEAEWVLLKDVVELALLVPDLRTIARILTDFDPDSRDPELIGLMYRLMVVQDIILDKATRCKNTINNMCSVEESVDDELESLERALAELRKKITP